MPRLLSHHAEIGVRERPETVELIEPVKQTKKQINRQSSSDVAAAPAPELAMPGILKPKQQDDKNSAGHQVHARRKPREQVLAKGAGANQESAFAARAKPFVLIGNSRQRQQKNVVVLLHVLRVMQIRVQQQRR